MHLFRQLHSDEIHPNFDAMSVLDPRVSGLFDALPPAKHVGDAAEPPVGVPGMESYRRGALHAELHPWCDRWVSIDTQSFRQDVHQIIRVPEAWGMLWFRVHAFDRSGMPRRADLLIVGAFDASTILPVYSCIHSDGIMMRPGAMQSVFGLPASETANRRFAAEEVWGIEGRHLHDRLMETACATKRLRLMADAIQTRVRRHASVAAIELTNAMRKIGSRLPLREIASFSGHSQRQLQRLFHDEVGMAPKRFETLLRLRRIISEVLRQSDPDWSRVALDHGFCDQSHFIHQWSAIFPMSPERLHRAYRIQGHWLDGMILLNKDSHDR